MEPAEPLMSQFFQQVVSGLASGGIFASLALALVLIYRATRARAPRAMSRSPTPMARPPARSSRGWTA